MNLSADIACRQCQLALGGNGNGFDEWCFDCCMRMLKMLHSDAGRESFLDHIERITSKAHAKRVRDAWKDFVVQRSPTKEK
jgi:hypothetical protein